jgi:hypothetical protein
LHLGRQKAAAEHAGEEGAGEEGIGGSMPVVAEGLRPAVHRTMQLLSNMVHESIEYSAVNSAVVCETRSALKLALTPEMLAMHDALRRWLVSQVEAEGSQGHEEPPEVQQSEAGAEAEAEAQHMQGEDLVQGGVHS